MRAGARPPVRRAGPGTTTRVADGRGRPAGQLLEVTYLPGLRDVVADEITEVLAPARPPHGVPGRDDALLVEHTGRLERALALRTAVAVFVVLTFDVPRPKSLTSGEHQPRIAAAMVASARLGGARTFRFEAAGHDSTVFQRLAAALATATGLRHDDTDGEIVVRFRRTPTRAADRPAERGTARSADRSADRALADAPGWDVLVRLGGRPLSARAWRVADFPGAVNATIAAATCRLAGIDPTDRVVNLMCGSGTLLVERLLAADAGLALGVDLAADAVAATRANLAAAGLTDRAEVLGGDVRDAAATWRAHAPFDLLLADPPWGTLHGNHATNAALHADLLRVAHEVAAPHARLVVLTHEIKVMERCLRQADGWWHLRAEVSVFAKGHHPRIYLLDRA